MQALFDSHYAGWGYFTDGTVLRALPRRGLGHARDERLCRRPSHPSTTEFPRVTLLADDSLPAFRAALGVADRRSSSALAELIISWPWPLSGPASP